MQRRIHPLLRGAILQRDEWICRYCGGEATEVDHVAPRARGGATIPVNLVGVCRSCNKAKGKRTPAEWRRDQALTRLLAKPSPCRNRRPVRGAGAKARSTRPRRAT